MGWTFYLSVYKKNDGHLGDEQLKQEVAKICDQQIRIPGCEPLWTSPGVDLNLLPAEPIPDHRILAFYFCKVQSSWNPFLSGRLILLTAKKIMSKFSGEVYVSIRDDFGTPFEKVENYSFFSIGSWIVITALLTPLWLVFLPLMMIFR